MVADSAMKSGGEFTGHAVQHGQAVVGTRNVAEPLICDSMHERKAIMAEKADAFVALPGGLGTPEEIFEVWSWRQLGFHTKPVGLLDAESFWTPLIGALRGIADAGFLPTLTLDDLAVASELPSLLKELKDRLRSTSQREHGESLRQLGS
ncbi:TIGR00730 family Rossman fold protein [Streptomyces misionensis]|uniref:LOG family protein n=1 Tax=Streptomyces misionensis TaxID=67331 RepID=UPI0033CBCBCB